MTADLRATNPFLTDQLENNTTTTTHAVFNPFAISSEGSTANTSSNSSNPFLQFSAITSTATESVNVATNPFASFFETEKNLTQAPIKTDNNIKSDNVFLPEQSTATSRKDEIELDLLLDDPGCNKTEPPLIPSQTAPVRGYDKIADVNPEPSPPRRPPPPRPLVSRKTKDLILSVTDALEATSSDLLDRLEATRTPSPTPLKDLNISGLVTSSEANDLLVNDDVSITSTHKEGLVENDFHTSSNIFDAVASLSEDTGIYPEPSSSPFVNSSASLLMSPPQQPLSVEPPAQPQPPNRPPPPRLSIQSNEINLTNLLGETTEIKPASVGAKVELSNWESSRPVSNFTNEIGLNYAATRKASHDITAYRSQIPRSQKKYSLDYSAVSRDSGTTGLPFSISDFPAGRVNEPPTTQTSQNDDFYSSQAEGIPPTKYNEIGNFTAPSVYNTNTEIYSALDKRQEETTCDQIFTTPHPATEIDSSMADMEVGIDTTYTSDMNQFSGKYQNYVPEVPGNSLLTSEDIFAIDGTSAKQSDDFDVFEQKFESFKDDFKKIEDGITSTAGDPFDPFGGGTFTTNDSNCLEAEGFGNEDTFDEFLALNHHHITTESNESQNSYQQGDFKSGFDSWTESAPVSRPADIPQKPMVLEMHSTFQTDPNLPYDQTDKDESQVVETPPTPLFDEDISQPLEPFPRTVYNGPGWEMQIRYPIKKKFTGQKFWKKVFVKLVYQGETPHLELTSKDAGKESLLHEWPLQPSYAISDIGAQQYDQYGKIFTVKVQFVLYKERPGVRPGQVTKAERLTNKLSQFAAYAIQGDYQGVKEFGSDLKKLGLPVEHSPQMSLICKLGSHSYEDMKQFSNCVEEAMFRLPSQKGDIRRSYKMEEVQITAVDELYVEQNTEGSVVRQIARVRLFFLGFLTGVPFVEIGVNDLRRQGKEVVGRHDIIPVVTEEWIRLENVEFHACVGLDTYDQTKIIKFVPPDACYLELMRFRVRPPKNRELPLQLKTTIRICGNKVDISADIMVPGFTSRKLGQIPCEDVAVRIPIPECWIYLFRVEKHFRYGSVKSAHRRTGKIKGIERFLGAVDTLETSLIEVTSGHAKYEHHHRSIVWRMSRLPKEGQGAYTNHNLVSHLTLTSFDQIPEELAKHCFVEFTMPITQVSHTTVRSVSITNSDSDSPPEKYVRHLARHEYRVDIEYTHAETTNDYIAATLAKPSVKAEPQTPVMKHTEPVVNSDSDSD